MCFFCFFLKTLTYSEEGNGELHYIDTDESDFLFTLVKSSFDDLKPFTKRLEFFEKDTSQEPFSQDNMKVIVQKKTKSSPEIEIYEAVSLGRNSYIIKKIT